METENIIPPHSTRKVGQQKEHVYRKEFWSCSEDPRGDGRRKTMPELLQSSCNYEGHLAWWQNQYTKNRKQKDEKSWLHVDT